MANRVTRSLTLLFLVALSLCVAHVLGSQLTARVQGLLIGAFTAVFLVSEAFFWKAIDGIGTLPQSEALSADETASLTPRVHQLKRRLVSRWFILLVFKAIAGGVSALLLASNAPVKNQGVWWLVGIGALVLSIPLALSFFHNWLQADELKARQVVQAKQQKERTEALGQLNKVPSNPLNADKILEGYTKVVTAQRRPSSK